MNASTRSAELLAHGAEAIRAHTFIRLTLASPRGGDVRKMIARLIDLRGRTVLAVASRTQRSETTANHPVEKGWSMLEDHLVAAFDSAHLQTVSGDWHWQRHPNGRETLKHLPAASRIAPSRAHDRAKPSAELSPSAWMQAMGFTRENGSVKVGMQDKLRQVARFTHILRDTIEPQQQPFRAVDMGCGRGALTCALYEFLQNYGPPCVLGAERQTHLVQAANAAAVGMTGLKFIESDIADVDCSGADILVALHACDTATDDAIRTGLRSGVRYFFLAPCCHKELRPQLVKPGVVEPILRHGIFLERYAEMLTDSLRALWLQAAGYKTRVFEFIGLEHSGRNIMITASRNNSIDRKAAHRAFAALKNDHGLDRIHLETP